MAAWFWLILAIVLEVLGTTCMKMSEGFTKLWPSVGIGVFYLGCICALTMALSRIDVSVAYAVWAGIGTALIALIGIFYFHEPAGALKVASIVMIIAGVVGLNLAGGAH